MALQDEGRAVRICLNASSSDRTLSSRFLNEFFGAGVQHIAFATDDVFAAGTAARIRADDYIRATVVLATVLFLLALSQRFRVSIVRVGVLVVAGGLMVYGLALIATFPRR